MRPGRIRYFARTRSILRNWLSLSNFKVGQIEKKKEKGKEKESLDHQSFQKIIERKHQKFDGVKKKK